VNIGLHEVVDRRVYQAVAGHGGHATEGLGDNGHPEMAVTCGCSGMADVLMTFVLDDEN
jgi:hypothetical protein